MYRSCGQKKVDLPGLHVVPSWGQLCLSPFLVSDRKRKLASNRVSLGWNLASCPIMLPVGAQAIFGFGHFAQKIRNFRNFAEHLWNRLQNNGPFMELWTWHSECYFNLFSASSKHGRSTWLLGRLWTGAGGGAGTVSAKAAESTPHRDLYVEMQFILNASVLVLIFSSVFTYFRAAFLWPLLLRGCQAFPGVGGHGIFLMHILINTSSHLPTWMFIRMRS